MPFDQTNFTLPAVETDEVLRVLTNARKRIEDPEHWHQGSCFGATRKNMCALGAVALEVGQDDNVYMPIWNYLDKFVPAPHRVVSEYNDARSTTHADVLALFDRAIAARRAEVASKAG